MPPTATTTTMRKPITSTTTLTQTTDPNAIQRRTTSGRAVRQNTTRPTNYYIKPYTSFSAAANTLNAEQEMQDAPPPGFFPALTYFTDAITALPKEVMRQFTLMKEVEAKIHGPNERLGEVVDAVLEFGVPRRKQNQADGEAGPQAMLMMAGNSVTGSTRASLINGVLPNVILSAQNSVSGSVDGEDIAMASAGGDEEISKRQQFQELRLLTSKLLINLDEKNVVLAEANRILAQQHVRLDSVLPYIDAEISEEARLGSMTHWAYSDNRQKKQSAGTAANRRDLAATNSLVAAASAIHESDIAQARRDATRENAREKHKGRSKEQVDSDFDDKPKKTHAKVAKSKAAAALAGVTGLGISANGEPVKKRKVDKGLAAPVMDRSMSSKGVKATKDTPRSTPNAEIASKKIKVKPAPLPAKKKGITTASPALASSPLHSSFNAASTDPARPQTARFRNNSTATNLRHEKFANDDRPTSAPVKVNGEKSTAKRKAPADGADTPDEPTRPSSFKLEDQDLQDSTRPHASRSHSNSGKAGRGSATGTPREESFTEDGVPRMKRSRSTRSMHMTRDESSSEPQTKERRGHKRQASNSHLVRQLAPFNRSPDLDRHLSDMDEDLEGLDSRIERAERQIAAEQSPPKRQRSRRNTGVNIALEADRTPASDAGDEDAAMPDVFQDLHSLPEPSAEPAVSPPPTSPPASELDDTIELAPEPAASPSTLPSEAPSPAPSADDQEAPSLAPDDDDDDAEGQEILDEEEYDSELGDPDDPNEQKYCYCDRGSYGEMIACDNEQCPREWFHLGCTGLREPPEESEKWFCRDCAPLFSHQRRVGRRGGRGGGRGRG